MWMPYHFTSWNYPSSQWSLESGVTRGPSLVPCLLSVTQRSSSKVQEQLVCLLGSVCNLQRTGMPFTSTGVGMEQRDWREQCEAVSGEGQMWDGAQGSERGMGSRGCAQWPLQVPSNSRYSEVLWSWQKMNFRARWPYIACSGSSMQWEGSASWWP